MVWIDGKKVVVLRKQQGLDQTQLAEAAGIAQSVISRMERGMQVDYKLSVVVSIARVLGVPVDTLLADGADLNPFDPELQAIITELEKRDAQTQRIAARTLRGLLNGLDS